VVVCVKVSVRVCVRVCVSVCVCVKTFRCKGHAKEDSNCNAAGDPDSPRNKFRVQREFLQKYPQHECYNAVDNDIDLIAKTDGDQVLGVGYNDGRAHITGFRV